ncbi:MAG: extracellular substrate binding-like orphan protein GrrP [Gloeobacterales cyanobacterium]
MLKKLAIAALSLACINALPAPVQAETVMEKIARTGELTVGANLDLVPYSYINDKKEWVGYSVDILNILKTELAQQLGKPISIGVVKEESYGSTRIPKLLSHEIDIACETQFTWESDRFVDFSLSYSISGIRLMAPTSKQLGSPESLDGKRIGVIENSIGSQVMKLVQPRATLVAFKSPEEGIAKLKSGQIDAVAGDTIIMSGLKQKLNLTDFQISPKEPYARYGLACMVPENNSTFLRLVNYSMVKLMQGYTIGDKKYVEMVNRWFGPEGLVEEIQPKDIQDFFKYTILTREQIPLTKP